MKIQSNSSSLSKDPRLSHHRLLEQRNFAACFGQRRHVANSVDVYGRRCHLSWQRCFSGAIMYRNPDPRNQALFTGNHWATTIQAKTALWPYNLGWFCRSDGAVAPALGGIKRLLRQLPRKPPAVHVCCHEQSCSRVGTHVVRATGKPFFFFIWGKMKWEDWSVTTEWPCSQSLREHANGDMLTNTRFSGQFFDPPDDIQMIYYPYPFIHPKLNLVPGLVWILQDPNTCGHHSETAMHCVVAVGSVECCKLLVEAEADLERMEPWNVWDISVGGEVWGQGLKALKVHVNYR